MNIHEYQAKALLHEFGVPISKGVPVLRASDSDVAAKTLGGPIWVVKSQIHAGGRGKGKFKEASAGDKGGVRIAKSVAEVNEFAKQMLGATLVTIQTGPHGKQVNRLYIEEGSEIDKEFYLSILVDPATGIMPHHGRTVAKALRLSGDLAKQAEKLVTQLYTAFVGKDMAMLEINPLVVTIGCMVNGAGLAMATMDIIKLYGMAPANFLDVGGGADKTKVTAAFKIITADPNVKGILVNIFGGIMKCDIIAEGVVAAVREAGLKVPLVVRLEGTNVDAGKKIIRESGLNVLPADDLDDAAQKIVKAVKGG